MQKPEQPYQSKNLHDLRKPKAKFAQAHPKISHHPPFPTLS